MRAKGFGEIGKIATLELAADDRHHLVEALDRASGRIDVGGLRIVDEAHTAALAHRLHHVLEAGEALERLREGRLGGTGQVADGGGRDDVAQHVTARQVHGRDRQQRHVAFRGAVPDEAAAGMNLGGVGVESVAHDPCPSLLRHPHRLGAVGVDHGPVVGLLVGEDSRLGGGVGSLAWMAIEVVGREIQQRRNPRPERVGGFKLKAAGLDHVHGVGGRCFDLRAHRVADIAAYHHAPAGGFEHAPHQRGGG